MKKKQYLLLLLLCCAIQAIAQSHPSSVPILRRISKSDALEVAKREFQGQNVDYYVIDEEKPSTWKIFVDADPLKGWEHECYVLEIPAVVRTENNDEITIKSKTLRTLPPEEGNYVPLEVTNRYATNSNSKPIVGVASLLPSQLEAASHTYALIISGGVHPLANYERYWNDCSFIYQTLVKRYGVPKANIYPLMSDGCDPEIDMLCCDGTLKSQCLDLDADGSDEITLAATASNISNTLSSLARRVEKDDQLFIFVIDHGGTDDNVSTSYINLWNWETLYDSQLASMLEPFTQNHVNVNVILGQCFSGGFIDNLSTAGCVVASASSGSEYSWACHDRPYDEFVYHWTCALNGYDHEMIPVNADTYSDEYITMDEAFAYARKMDRQPETPMYNSNPVSLGEDLTFNRIVPSIDLYIKNNPEDTGREPNRTTDKFWLSPGIWVRNQNDSIEVHQNPIFSTDDDVNYIYVKIHNRGKETYTTGKWLQVYWAKASTQIPTKTWRGRELSNSNHVTGYPITPKPIGRIEPGDSIVMKVNWPYPPVLETEQDADFHFCLLAKIMDHPSDEPYIEGVTDYNIGNSNDLAQKNVIVIKRSEISKSFKVFVRNTSNATKSYTLELKPQSIADAQFFSYAKVALEMSTDIYAAWERGGFQYANLELPSSSANGAALRTVKFVSPQSQLKSLTLNGDEFDIVKVKCNFTSYPRIPKNYKLDLIQRDENGEIVGGETFIIESPSSLSFPIEICSDTMADGRVSLKVDSDEFTSFEWSNGNGEIISNSKATVVQPTYGNNEYSVIGMTENGEVATGSIILDIVKGIKSISPINQNNRLMVELHSKAPVNASVTISSVLDGETVKTVDVENGSSSITVDTSNLMPGLYVVNYMINSEIIDNKKANIR